METDEFLGVAEVAVLLYLSKSALADRRRQPDFPRPVAELLCGPVWTRAAIVEYARQRSARFHERPGIEALAREPEMVSVEGVDGLAFRAALARTASRASR